MHILVCGGAGYIGAHMCKMLAGHGHQVTVLDNFSTGHADAVRWGPLARVDLLEQSELESAFAGSTFDAVMHFCARSLVGESVRDPGLYYRSNVTGTVNLLDAMVRHDVKKLIFSSTAAVYGTPQYTPIDEAHPLIPINPYGHSKRMVEQLLADYDRAYGVRSVSLRYFNAAGADPDGSLGEHHEPETHLIPNVLRSLLGGTEAPLQVFGDDYDTADGTCVRDYVHVNDLCRAHLNALDYLERHDVSEAFNLGNGEGYSVLEVIRATEQVTGQSIRYKIAPRRAGDPAVLVASAAKAVAQLNWIPEYPDIHDIIDTAWTWHRRVHAA